MWDIGDGVACFEFTSKMNALDPDIMALLGKASKLTGKSYKAMVIYNEGSNFSVGANLGLASVRRQYRRLDRDRTVGGRGSGDL